MTRVISVVLFILIFSVGPIAAQEVLEGTWKLVSSTRTNTTTGATTDSFGPNPLGYIMYGKDGLPSAERELGAVGASIVNRCIYCAAVHASRFIGLLQARRADPSEIRAANYQAKRSSMLAGLAERVAGPGASAVDVLGIRLAVRQWHLRPQAPISARRRHRIWGRGELHGSWSNGHHNTCRTSVPAGNGNSGTSSANSCSTGTRGTSASAGKLST